MKRVKKRMLTTVLAAVVGLTAWGMPGPVYGAVGDALPGNIYLDYDGTPLSGVYAKGISVSKYQNRSGAIDWERVKNSGVSFAFIRMGYLNSDDPHFDENMQGAIAAGLDTGVYFYTQAANVETAAADAAYVLEKVKEYNITYPICYDVESQKILDDGTDRQTLTEIVNTFCKTVTDAGYPVIIHANHEWLTNHLDLSQLPYDIWYPRYRAASEFTFPANTGIWQCSASGRVDGITGDVTIDLAYKDYPAMMPKTGFRTINGRLYWFTDGIVQKDTWIEQDGWYYAGADGAVLQNTSAVIDGTEYTFDAQGRWVENSGI